MNMEQPLLYRDEGDTKCKTITCIICSILVLTSIGFSIYYSCTK